MALPICLVQDSDEEDPDAYSDEGEPVIAGESGDGDDRRDGDPSGDHEAPPPGAVVIEIEDDAVKLEVPESEGGSRHGAGGGRCSNSVSGSSPGPLCCSSVSTSSSPGPL